MKPCVGGLLPPAICTAALFGAFVGVSACAATQERSGSSSCPLGEAVTTDGHHRLALVVGVGRYKARSVPSLVGPPNDARRIYELLTAKNGYGFPKENVCMLLDEQATTARFKETFEKALVERAAEKDVVLLYYAGHGSQTKDKNGDEPDENDETFLFHDARTDGVKDLVDDELNQMLARLHQKTRYVTVILDSCNSGTATRGEAGTFVARFVEPAEDTGAKGAAGAGDGGAGWVPEAFPGMVVFTAASDGTVALEENARGIFTDALVAVFSTAGAQPLTYAQAARQIPSLVAARSYQVPYFQGDLSGPVFGNTTRTQPIGWEVIATGPRIKLGGTPLPGMGKGAELRVYDGGMSGAEVRDPGKARATLVVDEMTGINALAHVAAVRPGAADLAKGDLAIPVRSADDTLKITVRLRPEREPRGIPAERARALRSALGEDPDAKLVVEPIKTAGDFELALSNDGRLQLFGPENRVRITYERDAAAVRNLWQHARQRALLQLRGEGGGDFTDNQTLQVQLVPAPRQDQCARRSWVPAGPNQNQVVPLCQKWNVKATLDRNAPKPLVLGGVILSTDGSSLGFPSDGRKVLLRPGESVTFNARDETFRAIPPLDVWDHVMVFGTQEANPVAWHLLTSAAPTRSAAGAPTGALHRALDRYLQPGTRGQERAEEQAEDTTWTLSHVEMRVEANARFLEPAQRDTPIQKREYTIRNFDIRPYMPDDEGTALHKVLAKADWLAHAAAVDGFGYKQHAWDRPTDEDNLRRGIDCSRAIWFAFTRAGLPYNRSNAYVHTGAMVGDSSLMANEFERCQGDPRLGDILVYRDDTQGDGHVVMVIDPDKRIAWGSHGFDGNARELKVPPDVGVEYQLIKYKKDWERWDRKTMERKACWRYRAFAQEASATRWLPGVKALLNVCNVNQRCGEL